MTGKSLSTTTARVEESSFFYYFPSCLAFSSIGHSYQTLLFRQKITAPHCFFAEMGVILAWGMAYALLNPRQRIVFDRTAKTVTIPGSLLMNKTEIIPYDQAELSYYHDMKSKIDEVKIYNPSGLPHGISVMPGRTDEALRLARFIHRYMEEEVVDKAELEKFKNREKPQQEEMEYFNIW